MAPAISPHKTATIRKECPQLCKVKYARCLNGYTTRVFSSARGNHEWQMAQDVCFKTIPRRVFRQLLGRTQNTHLQWWQGPALLGSSRANGASTVACDENSKLITSLATFRRLPHSCLSDAPQCAVPHLVVLQHFTRLRTSIPNRAKYLL